MKSYLLKSLSIVALIIAFGCSEEQTILQQEEEQSSNSKELLKAEQAALAAAGRVTIHAIYVECPGTMGSSCPQDLDPSISVYWIFQSPNCPNIYKVWVNSAEYYAIYEQSPGGTKHILNPPYDDDPRLYPEEDYNNCFN